MSIQNIVRIETHNNLVIELLQVEGEYLVDSRIVASGLGLEHESLVKTINTYQMHVEHFGILRFQIGEIRGRGQPEKYFLINRNQILFLITLSRNTEEVIEWKVAIIDALDQLEKQVRNLKAPKSQKWVEVPKEKLEEKVLGVITRRMNRATTEREKWISPAVVVNRLRNKYSVEDVEKALGVLPLQKCVTVNSSNNTQVVKYRLK